MKIQRVISLKTPEEIEILHQAGRILASIVAELESSLRSGMTTKDIDLKAEELIFQKKVKPAFKGYRGFPGCACVSVNEEVVHGIPGKRVVHDGDIVSIDVGIIYNGYYSDTAVTCGIGAISPQLQKLLKIGQESLEIGITQAKPGSYLTDISHVIQQHVERNGFSVVRDFVGHGIGQNLHEDPEIPNFGAPGQGPVLKEGMVFAIEPMVNIGTWQTKVLEDGWTVVTQDGKPSAHFEHCVAITRNGPKVLTKI